MSGGFCVLRDHYDFNDQANYTLELDNVGKKQWNSKFANSGMFTNSKIVQYTPLKGTLNYSGSGSFAQQSTSVILVASPTPISNISFPSSPMTLAQAQTDVNGNAVFNLDSIVLEGYQLAFREIVTGYPDGRSFNQTPFATTLDAVNTAIQAGQPLLGYDPSTTVAFPAIKVTGCDR